MRPLRWITSLSDRALSRALRIQALILVTAVAVFGTVYVLDQRVEPGPALAQRQVLAAEQAVRKAPDNVTPRLALAQAYQADHRLDDALKQYDEILRVDGTHRTALLGRAGVLLAKGDLAGAAAAYRKIAGAATKGEFAGADTQLEEAHYFLGVIASKQGAAKETVTQASAALAIEPTDSDAWYLLGTARLAQADPKQAVLAFQRALQFVPTGWCEPYAQLVVAYRQLRRAPQAAYASAMVDFCQKRPADARRELEALTTGPVAVEAFLGLGMVAESVSNRDEAIRSYRQVLVRDATNIPAITALSRLGVAPPAARSRTATPTASAPRG